MKVLWTARKFSADGKKLFSAGYDKDLLVLGYVDGFEIRTLIDNGWGVNVLKMHEDKDLIIWYY